MSERMLEIEKQLVSVQGQLKSLRRTKASLPDWFRTAGVAIFMTLIIQAMTSVWWASEITAKQEALANIVAKNTEYRYASAEKYQAIMIELNKLTITLEHLTQQNAALLENQRGE